MLAEQSGLYETIAPAFTDAQSHYATLHDMSREMFYVPGARLGAEYPISPALWFELSSQAAESLAALRVVSREASRAYLDGMIRDTERAIAAQIAIFLIALLLCGFSIWVVMARVLRPIEQIVDALTRAVRGETVTFSAVGRRDDEIGKLADVLQAFQQNIDEIKRTAAQLDQSQSRLKAIVEHAVDGLITIDAYGTIVSFNPACERIFGYSASEIAGRHMRLLTPALFSGEGDDLSSYVASSDAQRQGATAHEVTARRKDGAMLPDGPHHRLLQARRRSVLLSHRPRHHAPQARRTDFARLHTCARARATKSSTISPTSPRTI